MVTPVLRSHSVVHFFFWLRTTLLALVGGYLLVLVVLWFSLADLSCLTKVCDHKINVPDMSRG